MLSPDLSGKCDNFIKEKLMKICKYLLAIVLLNVFSFADENYSLKNIHFRYLDGKIIINYDLIGPTDIEYNVSLVLKRKSDSLFRYVPINLTGKFGEGKYAGKDRQIIWDISKESIESFSGPDYYFKITVEVIKPNKLLYIIGGSAILAGGGAAYFLLSKKKNIVTPVKDEFPIPNVRP